MLFYCFWNFRPHCLHFFHVINELFAPLFRFFHVITKIICPLCLLIPFWSFIWYLRVSINSKQHAWQEQLSNPCQYFMSNTFGKCRCIKNEVDTKYLCLLTRIAVLILVKGHIFWEGHKNGPSSNLALILLSNVKS